MSLAAVTLGVLGFARDLVLTALLLVAVSVLVREGVAGLARKLLTLLRQLPGVDRLIAWFLRREVRAFLKQIDPQSFSSDSKKNRVKIPEKGMQSAREPASPTLAWSHHPPDSVPACDSSISCP